VFIRAREQVNGSKGPEKDCRVVVGAEALMGDKSEGGSPKCAGKQDPERRTGVGRKGCVREHGRMVCWTPWEYVAGRADERSFTIRVEPGIAF